MRPSTATVRAASLVHGDGALFGVTVTVIARCAVNPWASVAVTVTTVCPAATPVIAMSARGPTGPRTSRCSCCRDGVGVPRLRGRCPCCRAPPCDPAAPRCRPPRARGHQPRWGTDLGDHGSRGPTAGLEVGRGVGTGDARRPRSPPGRRPHLPDHAGPPARARHPTASRAGSPRPATRGSNGCGGEDGHHPRPAPSRHGRGSSARRRPRAGSPRHPSARTPAGRTSGRSAASTPDSTAGRLDDTTLAAYLGRAPRAPASAARRRWPTVRGGRRRARPPSATMFRRTSTSDPARPGTVTMS